jgi:hypothetical protein
MRNLSSECLDRLCLTGARNLLMLRVEILKMSTNFLASYISW